MRMGWAIFILLEIFLGSFAEARARTREWPILAANKPTLCAITLNSKQEKETFQKYLPDFNFIELTSDDGAKDWMGEACQRGIRCDVLVISGHFAGTFFGRSGFRLSMEALEDYSCRRECDGILKHPKEVYLFGCNTLAGKAKDHRSIDEYVDVLVRDGFTPGQAQQTAAYRYSLLGGSFQDRMSRVFAGAQKVYGFSSVAPLGRDNQVFLENYLSRIGVGAYRRHLSSLTAAPNRALASAFRLTTFVERNGAPLTLREYAPQCILNRDGSTDETKMRWIHDVLQDPRKRFEHAPLINFYLQKRKREGPAWTAAEQIWLSRMAANTGAQKSFEGFLDKPVKGLLSSQVNIANLAYTLKWWSADRYRRELNRLLSDAFAQNLTRDSRDLICSLDVQMDVGIATLPPQPWSSDTIWALECMKPSDAQVQLALVDILLGEEGGSLRRAARRALMAMKPSDPRIQARLVTALEGNRRARSSAADVIEEMKIRDPQLIARVRAYDARLLEPRD